MLEETALTIFLPRQNSGRQQLWKSSYSMLSKSRKLIYSSYYARRLQAIDLRGFFAVDALGQQKSSKLLSCVAFGQEWTKDRYTLIGKYCQGIHWFLVTDTMCDNRVNMGEMWLDKFWLEFDCVFWFTLHEDNVHNVITDVSFPFNLKSLLLNNDTPRESLFQGSF